MHIGRAGEVMGEMADYYLEQDERFRESGDMLGMSDTLPEGIKYLQAGGSKGQQIVTMLQCIRSGDHWVDRKGNDLPFEKITKQHAKNLVRWLSARARILHDYECFAMCAVIPPTAPHALEGFEGAFDYLNEQDPKEWLEEQPLFKRLKEKAKGAR